MLSLPAVRSAGVLTRPTNALQKKFLARWETEVFEGRFHLPKSMPPLFGDWADECLARVVHANTRRRYKSSIENLKKIFGRIRLSGICAEIIEEYKEARFKEGVEATTINHDLRVLRRLLRLAERKQLIARNPFVQVEFLKQRSPRPPHIVTFDEEERILRCAARHLRVLIILILETGMRSHRELCRFDGMA